MFMSGGFHLPDGEIHFTTYGDGLVDYQAADTDAAFRYVTDWRVAIDAGANVGVLSKRMAQRFARVLAFEPIAETLECLRLNVPENVDVMPFALGAEEGPATLVRLAKSSGAAYVCPDAEERGFKPKNIRQAQMRSVDSLDLLSLGLIKLDVQGSELAVLQGAEQTLRRCRPVVMIEEKALADDDDGAARIAECRGYLVSLGMEPREKPQADRTYVFP
jgi:FkbM family methyltransferase